MTDQISKEDRELLRILNKHFLPTAIHRTSAKEAMFELLQSERLRANKEIEDLKAQVKELEEEVADTNKINEEIGGLSADRMLKIYSLEAQVKAKDICLVEALNILMNSPVRFKDTEKRIEEVLKDNKTPEK